MRAVLIVVIGLLIGCGQPKHVKAPRPEEWKPPADCKTLAVFKGEFATTLIHKGCFLRNDLITITVIVHKQTADKKAGEAAAEEFIQNIIRFLGYKPILTTLVITKIKGMPMFIWAVTGNEYEKWKLSAPKRKGSHTHP